MRWFARGRLWESREAERDDFQMQRHAASAPREPRGDRPPAAERRGSDWRPGGTHKDPRDRFKKKNRPERAWSEKDPATQRDRDKPGYVASKPREDWRDKPPSPPRGDRPWQDKPRGDRPWSKPPAGKGKRPWSGKPADRSGPPRERRPGQDKPVPRGPSNDRPWQTKPTGPRAQRKPWVGKPWSDKAPTGAPRGDRPWRAKPAGGPPRGDRPADPRRSPSGHRPGGWTGKPRDPNRKPFTPRPRTDANGAPPRKRRDDED
jgi:23S rRNA pseudouridine2605 synthase